MKRITMTDIQTTAVVRGEERTLFLPGGWEAVVPEMRPDPASLRAFTRYLQGYGMTEWAAEQEALATLQGVFEGGYVRGIRNMLYARAREYVEMYPHLVREDGTLAGFDPAVLQQAYFPFDRPGRGGKNFASQAMAKMAAAGDDAELEGREEDDDQV